MVYRLPSQTTFVGQGWSRTITCKITVGGQSVSTFLFFGKIPCPVGGSGMVAGFARLWSQGSQRYPPPRYWFVP
jgi:hypothetical protein